MKKIIALILLSFSLQSQTLIKYKQMENPVTTTSLGVWSLSGNTPSTHTNFIGTTNNTRLVLKANNFIVMKGDSLNGNAYFPKMVSIGNKTTAATRDLDIHNVTGIATAEVNSEDPTLYSGLYAQGNNVSYYSALNQFGSAITFSNHLRRNNSSYLDLTSPWSTIINPVPSGTLAIGVGGMLAANEAVRITTTSVNMLFKTAINSTVSPTYTLDVTGNVRATSTLNVLGNTTLNTNTTNTLTSGNTGTIAVLSDAVFTTTHFHSSTGTFSNFTYYFDKSFAGISTSSGVTGRTYIPVNCTLIGYTLITYVGGTLGTAEAQSYYVRVNNTTDITLTTSGTANAITNTSTSSALNTNLTAGDYIEIKGIVPVMATGYTNTSRSLTLFFKLR